MFFHIYITAYLLNPLYNIMTYSTFNDYIVYYYSIWIYYLSLGCTLMAIYTIITHNIFIFLYSTILSIWVEKLWLLFILVHISIYKYMYIILYYEILLFQLHIYYVPLYILHLPGDTNYTKAFIERFSFNYHWTMNIFLF